MTSLARRASCSKETLYKWFGDRDGLLSRHGALAGRRRCAPATTTAQRLDAEALRDSLEAFAANWLKVISSRTSIALNRVAVSHAGVRQEQSRRDRARQRPLRHRRAAEAACSKRAARPGCSPSTTPKTAFRTFFGLVGRDVQIRLLLGDRLKLTARGDRARRQARRRPVPHPLRGGQTRPKSRSL